MADAATFFCREMWPALHLRQYVAKTCQLELLFKNADTFDQIFPAVHSITNKDVYELGLAQSFVSLSDLN